MPWGRLSVSELTRNLDSSSESFAASCWLAPVPLESLGVSPADCFLRSTPFAFWAAMPAAGLTGVLGPSDRLAGLPFLLAILDMPPCLSHQRAELVASQPIHSFSAGCAAFTAVLLCGAPLAAALDSAPFYNVMALPTALAAAGQRSGAVSTDVALLLPTQDVPAGK